MSSFKKITYDDYSKIIESKHDITEYLEDRVSLMLFGNKMEWIMMLEESVLDCESPIEQLLAVELENIGLERMSKFNPFIDVIGIEKQKEIITKNNRYRVDFLIPVVYKNQDNIMFVIECDGHEFHQKTKQQVEADNKRQRDLIEAGYEVIRFSGTEIYHRPSQCASTIKNIILSKCKYIKDE